MKVLGEIFSVRYRAFFAVILVTALLLITAAANVFAIDTLPSGPAQGIQVSPVLIDLNADKNNSYDIKITVTNVTAKDLVLKGYVNDFRAKDENGNPEVILDENPEETTFSLRQWMTVPSDIPLKSKESKPVIIKVNVPANAEAGGHYGVVRFSGLPPGEESNNVSIAASVGVLVLARINGNITENLSLKEFFIEKDGKKTSLAHNGPLTIVERIHNDGNVHVKPKGNITVKNMFGSTVATLPLIEPPRNILPDSTRKFSQTLKQKWMFGRYTARLEATYGYSNKVLSGTFSFWVIPYKIILVSILIIVLLVFLFRKGLKRYNEKIIKKAMKNRE